MRIVRLEHWISNLDEFDRTFVKEFITSVTKVLGIKENGTEATFVPLATAVEKSSAVAKDLERFNSTISCLRGQSDDRIWIGKSANSIMLLVSDLDYSQRLRNLRPCVP